MGANLCPDARSRTHGATPAGRSVYPEVSPPGAKAFSDPLVLQTRSAGRTGTSDDMSTNADNDAKLVEQAETHARADR